MTGLINPNYGYGGLDGAVHLAEDCFNPSRTVPRAICYSLIVGFVTSFFFAVAMLYSLKDIQAALLSRTGSVYDASKSSFDCLTSQKCPDLWDLVPSYRIANCCYCFHGFNDCCRFHRHYRQRDGQFSPDMVLCQRRCHRFIEISKKNTRYHGRSSVGFALQCSLAICTWMCVLGFIVWYD